MAKDKSRWSHKNDYPITEIWNTDNFLAQMIVPRLQAFKALDKHGYAAGVKDMEEWNCVIQKMIDAFELMKFIRPTDEDSEKTINEGLALFCKYFRNLWD